jgi:integrase
MWTNGDDAMSATYGRRRFVDGGIIRRRGAAFVGEVNHAGRRTRKTFSTAEAAEKWIKQKREDVLNLGTRAMRLDGRRTEDALQAIHMLNDAATLREAARFWLRHHRPQGGTRTVDQLYREYLQAKIDTRRRPATIREIRNRVGRFAKTMGERQVHDITPADLVSWVRSLDVHGFTKNNYIRMVRGFFTFALRQDLIERNPADRLEMDRIDERLPDFLPVTSVQHVLKTIEKTDARAAVILALQFFAGLRTAEAIQIRWEDIDFEEGIVRVRPEVSKKHRSRNVDILPNLRAWLTKHRQPAGLIVPNEIAFRRAFRKMREDAKITAWPHNAARHSFATYHVANFEDAAKTSLQLGHKDATLLYNHYRGLASRKDAAEYWAIVPTAKDAHD